MQLRSRFKTSTRNLRARGFLIAKVRSQCARGRSAAATRSLGCVILRGSSPAGKFAIARRRRARHGDREHVFGRRVLSQRVLAAVHWLRNCAALAASSLAAHVLSRRVYGRVWCGLYEADASKVKRATLIRDAAPVTANLDACSRDFISTMLEVHLPQTVLCVVLLWRPPCGRRHFCSHA